MRARSALVVTCRNCDHAAFISARFLKERFYLAFQVVNATFRCRVCGCRNVKLSATPEELAITRVDPRMHFAGIYEGRLLD
jgi:predicted nucleic-acid-binding Zn-ribbon protein